MIRKTIILLLLLLWMTQVGFAEEQIPTIKILPDDVVQESIQQRPFAANGAILTNEFIVRWIYTEAGARKLLTFTEAHEGENVRTIIGGFETPIGKIVPFQPLPGCNSYAEWKAGWLKRRTDKIFGVREEDAKAIVAGLEIK
jgi:hypothetical protein